MACLASPQSRMSRHVFAAGSVKWMIKKKKKKFYPSPAWGFVPTYSYPRLRSRTFCLSCNTVRQEVVTGSKRSLMYPLTSPRVGTKSQAHLNLALLHVGMCEKEKIPQGFWIRLGFGDPRHIRLLLCGHQTLDLSLTVSSVNRPKKRKFNKAPIINIPGHPAAHCHDDPCALCMGGPPNRKTESLPNSQN